VHLDDNLLDPAYCDALPQKVAKALGSLDVIVNNAGVITRGCVTETSDDDGGSRLVSMSKHRSAYRTPQSRSSSRAAADLSSTSLPAGACGRVPTTRSTA